jgi:hypothetical protein
MPSTYTTNGGIELPANGEQSGTWGSTVNDNMNIVDRLTNGVGVISLSGTTHTLTTADGTPSDGHYSVLVLGGAPSGTNTITIAPNDGQHVYIVKNSSGQSAIFSQGSGANVTVLNGKSVIIYSDGAGAGAAVVDITSTFQFGAVDIDGGTIDGTVIGGAVPAAGTFTTLAGDTVAGDTVAATTSVAVGASTVDATELGFLENAIAGTIVNSKAVIYSAAGQVNATSLALSGTALTASAVELNYVDGVTSAIQTQIDAAVAAAAAVFPTGGIIIWSGSAAAIPAGWLLCNGTSGTPDLRDRFVVGAGSTYAVGATGGSADAVAVAHTHTFSATTGGAGAFSFTVRSDAYGSDGVAAGNGGGVYSLSQPDHTHTVSGTTASTGVSGTNANLPPYYALCYIMKS